MLCFESAQIKEIRPMMGHQSPPQDPLFSVNVQLETRVRTDHPLRSVKELIDFDFVYNEVAATYGENGNVSVPPPVILKLMLLLILYNVRSERELMETLPERLDWLWFLGYTLDTEIPDHSVLSKARTRWGKEAFKHFFERIVLACVKAGLVDGMKIFVDSSFIDADASNGAVIDTHALSRYLNERYQELEKRLEEKEVAEPRTDHVVNRRYLSTTDPDASIVRQGRGGAKLQYKTHRAVDAGCEIITAVEVTPGAINEGHKMASLIDGHEATTDTKIATVVADSQYGTKENFLLCHDKGIAAHMPVVKYLNEASRKGIFSEDQFVYDGKTDTFICPAGQPLKGRTLHGQNREYLASRSACRSCPLKPQCTRARVRTLQRHSRQEALDHMFLEARTPQAKRDIATRQYLMERSFARSTRYGFDRARWRGLWRVAIQEYLVCALQNIMTLVRFVQRPTSGIRTLPIRAKRVLYAMTSGVLCIRLIVPLRRAPQRCSSVRDDDEHHVAILVWATGRKRAPVKRIFFTEQERAFSCRYEPMRRIRPYWPLRPFVFSLRMVSGPFRSTHPSG
jgi:transposase